MPHVVTERCVACRYTDCCTVCPVDCFYEVQDPKMLVIDPETCIDCQLCVSECPVHAIYQDEEVPEPYKNWIGRNAELVTMGANITAKKEPLEGALTLEQIQERERASGLNIPEPGSA